MSLRFFRSNARKSNGIKRVLPFRGNVAGFNPLSIAGAVSAPSVAAMRAAGTLWQDSGKTIPATANNDPVRVIREAATGIEYTSSSDAARGLLQTDGSKWWILGNGSTTRYQVSIPIGNVDWSVYVALRSNGDGTNQDGIFSSNGANQQWRINFNSANKFGFGPGPISWTPSVNFNGNNSTLGIEKQSGSLFGFEGSTQLSGSFAYSTDFTLENVFTLVGGANSFNGRIYGWYIGTASLSVGNRSSLASHLRGLYQ